MNKKLILIVLLLTSTLVLAQEAQEGSPDLAYSWLLDQPNQNVFNAALTSLALSRADTSRAQPYLDYIIANKHSSQPCWPANSCNIKDTSLVLIVEAKIGFNSDFTASEIADWLTSRQRSASLPGQWVLQIITPETGTCSLAYQKVGERESNPFQLNVDEGKISHGSCTDETFFNLGSCLSQNPLSKPSTNIRVQCPSLTNVKISLTYVEGNTYYLITSPQQTRASFTVNNGYFGNLQNTVYANWALSKVSENEVNSLLWLRKNAINKVQGEGVLYLLTRDQSYLTSLANLQSAFGAFSDQGSSPNEFLSGFGSLILQESGQFSGEVQRTREWLGNRQKDDGSWSSRVDTTAMILYGAYLGATLPELPSGTTPPGTTPPSSACTSDLGCPFGESCQSGACVPIGISSTEECTADLECSIGETCQSGSCVIVSTPPPECTTDVECPSGEFCSKSGICELVPPECLTNIECPSGEICSTNGLCITEPIQPLECTTDIECLSEEFCTAEGVCEPIPIPPPECATDIGCPPGEVCTAEGVCIPEQPPTQCIPDWDCTEWTFCIDGSQSRECTDLNDCNIQCTGELSCITQKICEECAPEWQCTEWSQCTSFSDTQSRSCRTVNDCDAPCLDAAECIEEQQCSECVSVWECTPWSVCSDFDTQTRDCFDISNCGVDCSIGDSSCANVRDCLEDNETIFDPFEPPESGEETTKEPKDEPETQICVVNGECEPEFGENEDNCPEDCLVSLPPIDVPPGFDDEFPLIEPGDDLEEPEKSRTGLYIFLIIILLIIILAATYFLVLKKKKPAKGKLKLKLPFEPGRAPLFGPAGPKSQLPGRPPRQPIRRVKKQETELEKELGKSIKEAKKLIGKK